MAGKLGCLLGFLKFLAEDDDAGEAKQAVSEPLPYVASAKFLSEAERSFYLVGLQVVGERYRLFAKVRLADLVEVPRKSANWQRWFNRISAKHIDFVLTDPTGERVLACFELDDSSHKREERQARDSFVDQVMKAAGVPIVRFPAQRSYDVAALRAQIDQAVAARP